MRKIALLVLAILSTTMIRGFTGSVEASGAICIRADGSVFPSTANITSVDNMTYTFTNDNCGSLVVQRDNIVVDGAGYTLQGTRFWNSKGVDLAGRRNVTIENMEIKEFFFGIWLKISFGNSISGNKMTHNKCGIWLSLSSNNNISQNHVSSNMDYGIYLEYSSSNYISGNRITAKGRVWEVYQYYSFYGIYLRHSSSNTVSENDMTNSGCGVELFSSSGNNIHRNNITSNTYGLILWKSSNSTILGGDIARNDCGILLADSSSNLIHHCNFVDNAEQVHSQNSANAWDDGYPSGGSYWSDYGGRYPNAEELDESGIWNMPYVLDQTNQDNFPLMRSWAPEEEASPPAEENEVLFWTGWQMWAMVAVATVILTGVVFLLRKRITRVRSGI